MTQSQRLIAAGFLVLAVGVFSAVRIAKSSLRLWDFNMYAAAADAWLQGQNPYDETELKARWNNTTGKMNLSAQRSIAPATTLVVISPFTLLPLQVAFVLWTILSVSLIVTAIFTLWRFCGWTRHDPGAWIMLACVLASGPFILGISVGQPSLPAVALIIFAARFILRGRERTAGILLALATALKLQLGAPIILYYLIRRRWRAALWSGAMFSLLTLIALTRLQAAGVVWADDWLINIQQSSTAGGPNDVTPPNKTRDHLLNLQLPFYAIAQNRAAASALAWVVTAVLIAVLALRRKRTDNLLELSIVLILMLLPVYHRYYDAIVLMVALAWSLRFDAKLPLLLMIPFLLPVGWAMNLIARGYVSDAVLSSRLWNIIVMSEQSWMMLTISIVLLYAQLKSAKGDTSVAPTGAAVSVR
jgi:hypothetical protein